MARKSNIARDLKREKQYNAYAVKRADKLAKDLDTTIETPRNASVTRRKNRCSECGRPHAYMRQFALCRICFREHASKGEIPGVIKSSW